MGKRGPLVTDEQRRERIAKLKALLRARRRGDIGPTFAELCYRMELSGPTVRKIAREGGLDLSRTLKREREGKHVQDA